MVSGKVPEAVGVPLRVAVPFPLSTNVTPLGRLPDSVMAGVGLPVVVTVNDPNVPCVKVTLFPLVIVGATLPVGIATINTSARASTPTVPVGAPEVDPRGPMVPEPAQSLVKATKFPVCEGTPIAFAGTNSLDLLELNVWQAR